MSAVSKTIRSFALCAAVFLLSSKLYAASSVPQVYLVQNSGWMLPFYDDPSSRLKDIVAELSGRVRQFGGGQQVLASFNQSLGENKRGA